MLVRVLTSKDVSSSEERIGGPENTGPPCQSKASAERFTTGTLQQTA